MSQFDISVRFMRNPNSPEGSPEHKLRWFSFSGDFKYEVLGYMAAGHALFSEYPDAEIVAVHDG